MLPVYVLRVGVLAATSLLCLTLLTACENNAAADQFTQVQGTITDADTKRPLAGILVAVEPYASSFYGPMYQAAVDSARTDAQGKYALHFYNKKGLYYTVSFDPYQYLRPTARARYLFVAGTQASEVGPANDPARRYLKLGASNVVDFTPNEQQVLAVRIRNRNTRYQRLKWDNGFLHGNSLDTTAHLYVYSKPPLPHGYQNFFISYQQTNAAGTVVKDTSVALVFQNPTARPPDTVRATLTFIR